MKMRSSGPYSRTIFDDDGEAIGQALQLSNLRWAPFDFKDQCLIKVGLSFSSDKKVLAFFRMTRDPKP